MKIRSLIKFSFLIMPLFSYAQRGQIRQSPPDRQERGMREELSALSVYSEQGELFYLVINGVKQNPNPQSRVRVEGLPQFGNDVQILFADNMTRPINKRITIADPVDGRAVNLSLKIVRERDGDARLKFHMCSEVDHNYRRQNDEYVMSYGTVQGGSGYQSNNGYDNSAPPPPPLPPAPMAMDDNSFNDAKQSVKNVAFDETKMSTAKTIFGSNYLNVNQVMQICRLFAFDEAKMTFAQFMYDRTVDKNVYYKVADVFSFDSDKQTLNDFISSHQK